MISEHRLQRSPETQRNNIQFWNQSRVVVPFGMMMKEATEQSDPSRICSLHRFLQGLNCQLATFLDLTENAAGFIPGSLAPITSTC